MTIALATLIVILCVIVAVDLLLTRTVLLKLGDQSKHLATLSSVSRSALRAGDVVPPFAGEDEEGDVWSPDRLAGRRTAIAFFSATCPACRDHQPEFAEIAAGGDFDQTLTVISGDRDAGRDLVETARAVGSVLVEDERRHVSRAFAVEAFPAFVVVEGATVDRVSGTPEALRLHTPVVH